MSSPILCPQPHPLHLLKLLSLPIRTAPCPKTLRCVCHHAALLLIRSSNRCLASHSLASKPATLDPFQTQSTSHHHSQLGWPRAMLCLWQIYPTIQLRKQPQFMKVTLLRCLLLKAVSGVRLHLTLNSKTPRLITPQFARFHSSPIRLLLSHPQ